MSNQQAEVMNRHVPKTVFTTDATDFNDLTFRLLALRRAVPGVTWAVECAPDPLKPEETVVRVWFQFPGEGGKRFGALIRSMDDVQQEFDRLAQSLGWVVLGMEKRIGKAPKVTA